ncbi:MAG: hypothetical protein H6Q65_879 [Firmicutes bacterium]|nr:hypothetical protein [Bacillota bacterium]
MSDVKIIIRQGMIDVMNTTKMNAFIGFATVIAAGLLLLSQEDTKVGLSDSSSAWVAGFVFLSIVVGMVFWRNNSRRTLTSSRKGKTKAKKR